MKTTLNGIKGKYMAIAPIAILNQVVVRVQSPIVVEKANNDFVTLPPVFYSSDDLEELRADLHLQVDDLVNCAKEYFPSADLTVATDHGAE